MKAKLYLFATAVMLAAVFSGCKDDPIPPTVVTKPASGIAEGTATLNAEITNQGSDAVTSCGFYYNTSADMSYPEVVDANLDGSRFSSVISSLEPGKTYYYMAYAKSSAGMAEGEVKQFTTSSLSMPTVQTNNASSITSSGATLNGNVTADGGATVTVRGFVYGTSASNLSQNVQSGSGTGSFTKALTGLSHSTTYYYKAYATNAIGTNYGEVKQFTTTGTLNGHDWVDLGLPSGLRWATCNVGASTPTAYGNYYAWGETSTKTTYNNSTYTYTGAHPTTLPSSADAATANWGSAWRMPTKEEFEELKNNCTSEWTTQNGVNGRLFTGPNGNSIFLPAAGYRDDNELYNAGSYGDYWSSSLYSSYAYGAWSFYFNSGSCYVDYYFSRYFGRSVRAVCQSQN